MPSMMQNRIKKYEKDRERRREEEQVKQLNILQGCTQYAHSPSLGRLSYYYDIFMTVADATWNEERCGWQFHLSVSSGKFPFDIVLPLPCQIISFIEYSCFCKRHLKLVKDALLLKFPAQQGVLQWQLSAPCIFCNRPWQRHCSTRKKVSKLAETSNCVTLKKSESFVP